jgi:antitoxin component YwqK of YwqJK toxin-antitoxin module
MCADGYDRDYYPNGNLLYEGEWKDGWRNGQGKEYYENGKLKYEGEWKDYERNG